MPAILWLAIAIMCLSPATVAAEPVDPIHLNARGLEYFAQGDYGAAYASFELASTLKPEEPEYLNNAGSCRLQQNRWAEAEALFRKAGSLRPLPLYQFNLGLALFAQDRIGPATAAFEEAVRGKSDFSEAWFQLGLARMRAGNAPGAKEAWEKAAQIRPDADVYINLGAVHMQEGRLNDAEHWFQKAAELRPGTALPHYNLGVLAQKRAAWEKAEKSYLRALELDSNLFYVYYNLGLVQARAGKKAQARGSFRKFLANAPAEMKEQRAEAAKMAEELEK